MFPMRLLQNVAAGRFATTILVPNVNVFMASLESFVPVPEH